MDVLQVQTLLAQFGFDPGALDGVWGPRTLAAVKAFQEFAGAPVTGVIDDDLVGYLGEWETNDRTMDSESARAEGGADDGATASDNPLPDPRAGTVAVGTGGTQTTLPTGMRLVKVNNPAGSDAGALYYTVGTVFGAEVAFEVGDEERLNEMFGGVSAFDDISTMTQAQFDDSDTLLMGSVDEIAGSTESLQAQYERDMRSAGLENPPAWIVGDKKAMAVMVTAANEGWSTERTYGELAKLESFQTRFPGLDTVQAQLGTTSIGDAIADYTQRETAIRSSILRFRGPHADTSPEYTAQLIGSGWQAFEIKELLELESEVKNNEAALQNINAIFSAQGLPELSGNDFVDLLSDDRQSGDADFTPGEVYEAVNDALRQTALANAGLNIGTDLAASLGTGVSTDIQSAFDFKEDAQRVAGIVAANAHDINLDRYGLSRDNVIQFMLGESEDPEIGRKLERVARERNIAGQGHASTGAFIGQDSRLQVQGLGSV